MRPSASTSALPNSTTTITAEQRKQRLIESRKKYSTRPTRHLNQNQNPQDSSSLDSSKNSTLEPPPNFSRPLAPRMSRAPSDSMLPKTSRHLNRRHNQNPEDDFRIDHRSMAMIESGNVVIPNRNRPSMYGRGMPRNTIGGGGLRKFRNSIAPQQEPRQSLFPLGINIFTASEAEKSEVEGWLKERIEAATPAKPGPKSTLLLDATKSTQRIVRFREGTPKKQEEEEEEEGKENLEKIIDSGDVVVTMTTASMSSPVSILKVEKKKTTFSATPIPTRRRLKFDQDDDDEESSLTSSYSLRNPEDEKNEEKEKEKVESVGQKIENLKRIVTEITTSPTSPPPTSPEIEALQKIAENLVDWLKKHQNPENQKTKKNKTTTQLVPICEDEDEEEEEEDVAVEVFGKLRIGEISPQKLIHLQPLSTIDNNTSERSEPSLDQAFLG